MCVSAYCQKVLTRILPSDQLILESTPPSSSPYSSNGPSSRSHGRTVVWCLVQDLDPESDKVESLELFFKSAPLAMTGLDSDSELFEGSFSQLGTPSVPESREDSSAARPPDKFQPGSEFKTEDGADEVTRIKVGSSAETRSAVSPNLPLLCFVVCLFLFFLFFSFCPPPPPPPLFFLF